MSAEEYHNPHDADSSNEPRGYHVDNDKNLEEKDLKRHYLFGEAHMADPDSPGHEGVGDGGQNFGKTNVTASGDDSANPSRNAGHNNAYFKRAEPSEEHPENSNFKPAHQQDAPIKDWQWQSNNGYYKDTSYYDGSPQRGEPARANPVQNIADDGGNQSELGSANWNADYRQERNQGGNGQEEKEHIET